MSARLDTLICKGCGARLSYAAGLQALQCEYCDTVMEIARAAPVAAATAAQSIIPMTIEDNVLAYAVLQYLAANHKVPDDMVERAVLSAKRFYMPCFTFKGSYTAIWTASFGYNRNESYIDYVNRQVNGQSQRVPVTRNRTVVDWRPVNGQDAGGFALLGYAGSGLAPSASLLLERLRNLDQATPFDIGYVSGVDTHPYTLAPNDTYALHIEAQVNKLVEAGVMRHAQGDQQRDWHWSANTRWTSSAVYVPVGHVMLEYGGKQYNIWVDGTDPANLATDALPLNLAKANHTLRGMILPMIATLALMFAGLASSSFWYEMTMERLAAVGVLWGLSAWRDRRRNKRSQHARQSALAKRAVRYAQPAAAPTAAAPASGPDVVSLVLTLVSAVIVGVLLYRLAKDPAAPRGAVAAVTANAAPAAPTGIRAAASAPVQPAPALPPVMAAANAGDWDAVGTLMAAAAPPAPVSKADKAASAAAFARGAKALLNKNNAAAITAFQLAIEANGANMDARNKLGVAYIRAGEHEHAHQVLGELVAEAPRHVEGWRNMAEAAALSDRPEEADASLRVLLHVSKDRKRTTEALKKRAASGEADKFGEAVARVVKPDTGKAGK